ncbi:MAG: flagellar basal body rod protein FlgB [Syntrophothermus sp.]
MGLEFFSGVTDKLLRKGLDATALRHEVISNNLANVDTPRFKRSEVRFEDALRAAMAPEPERLPMKITDPGHLEPKKRPSFAEVQPEVVQIKETTGRLDGNNVDIDAEMARLAENTILYNTMTQLVSRRLGMLRSAINEGRR